MNGSDLYLRKAAHVHEWKYVSDGTTINAYCVNTADTCHYYGEDNAISIIKLIPQSYEYTDDVIEYEVQQWGFALQGLETPQVKYYLYDGTTLTDNYNSGAVSEGTAPMYPGTYKVKVTVGDAEAETTMEIYMIYVHIHMLGTYHEGTAPTCTTPGTKSYYDCANGCDSKLDADGYEIWDMELPATGHDFSDNAQTCRNGCGTVNPDYKEPVTEEPTTEEPTTEEPTTEASTEAPTEKPTEAPTETPTEAPTQAPTEASTQAPTEATTEAPTEAPTQAPTEVPTETPTEPVIQPTEPETDPVIQPTTAAEDDDDDDDDDTDSSASDSKANSSTSTDGTASTGSAAENESLAGDAAGNGSGNGNVNGNGNGNANAGTADVSGTGNNGTDQSDVSNGTAAPKTGDARDIFVWSLIISVIAMIGTGIYGKNYNR